MRNPHASYNIVPKEVFNSLPPNPDIIKLEARRSKLKNSQYYVQGNDNKEEVQRLTT